MKSTIVPVDVIQAGAEYVLDSDYLDGFHTYCSTDDYYFYKKINIENGAVLTITYRKEFSYITVKFSAPKLIYGTNAKEISREDIPDLLDSVNKILAKEKINVDFASFRVSRLELSKNYVCRSEGEKMHYIDVLKRRAASRKKKSNYATSAVLYNKSCRLTVYDKYAEMLAHNAAKHIKTETNKILRVEYKMEKAVLKKYSKNLSVENVLCNLDLCEIYATENKKTGIFDRVLSSDRFFKVLGKQIEGKTDACKKRIVAFYKELNVIGEQAAKEKYSKYTFSTYTKIMKGAGYNIMYSYSNVRFVDFCNPDFFAHSISKEKVKEIVFRCHKEKKRKAVKYRLIQVGKKCPPCLSYLLFWFDTS